MAVLGSSTWVRARSSSAASQLWSSIGSWPGRLRGTRRSSGRGRAFLRRGASPGARRHRSPRCTLVARRLAVTPLPQARSATVQSCGEEGEQRFGREAIAVELAAQLIPFVGDAGEEGLAVRLARLRAAREPQAVLREGAPVAADRGGSTFQSSRAAAGSSPLVIRYRLAVRSPRAAIHPSAARTLRCRETVDCGSCRTSASSETWSSCASRSASRRRRAGSASEARRATTWSAGEVFIRKSGLKDTEDHPFQSTPVNPVRAGQARPSQPIRSVQGA